jgi:hypothetical protein
MDDTIRFKARLLYLVGRHDHHAAKRQPVFLTTYQWFWMS